MKTPLRSLGCAAATAELLLCHHVATKLLSFGSSTAKGLTPEEVSDIMKDFDEPAPSGLLIGGIKYMVIQGEPTTVIRGKKL